MKVKFLFTCEHGGFQIPAFAKDLKIPQYMIQSHAAWDQGALDVANILQKKLKGRLVANTTNRLLIDYNRRLDNGALSSLSKEVLSLAQQKRLVKDYQSYRDKVFDLIDKDLKKGFSIFVFSVHSFIPVYKTKKRKTDIGLLFRPRHKNELSLASKMKKSLLMQSTHWSVHFNRPYRGHTDCFLNDVLDSYKKNTSVNGVFLELNQRTLRTPKAKAKISSLLGQAILDSCRN